jgi:hypothetical protein
VRAYGGPIRLRLVVLAAFGLLLCAPAAAHARLVAAISQGGGADPFGFGQRDIRVLDPLDPNAPANDPDLRLQQSVNTVADEIDVSLSADGRYLAFKRVHPFTSPAPAGLPDQGRFITDRSLEVNSPLATKGMVIESGPIGTGTISPNATRYARHQSSITSMSMKIYSLDVTQRPIQATPIGTIQGPFSNAEGTTGTPAFEFGGSRVTWSIDPKVGQNGVAVGSLGGTTVAARVPALDGGRSLATSDAVFWPCCGREHVFYTHSFTRTDGDGNVFESHVDLGAWNPISSPTPSFGRFDGMLEFGAPGLVAGEERAPKTSPDGRYVAWIEQGTEQRIRVWDRLFQGYVGAPVPIGSRKVQSWALAQTDAPVIVNFHLATTLLSATQTTLLSAQLGKPVSVGIFVHRVVGTRTLFGQRVPRLVAVGRVPLGRQKRGRVTIPWTVRVGGKRLRPGRYQITLRALRGSRVIELSKPRFVRVR